MSKDNRLIRDDTPLAPGQIRFMEGDPKDWPTPSPATGTILDEAKAAVLGSRAEDYGRCFTLYSKMAQVMNALFADRLNLHGGFAATDMPIIQIVLKICREQYKAKRDNRVDIAGYAEVLDQIRQDTDRMFGSPEKKA